MADPLLFGRLAPGHADARRARPRRFRLFNAHLEQYLSEHDVKSRFRFGRECINHVADFHGQMVPSFSSVEDDNCSFGIFNDF